MDTHLRLIDWLKLMGYNGKIPEDLKMICNSSTSVVLGQLMENARPKQEVDHIKQNIIINRLKKPLSRQNEFDYCIEEIDTFKTLKDSETKKNLLNARINEKDAQLGALEKNNKMQKIQLENLKAKIKLHEQREFLLKTNQSQLDDKIKWAEDFLAKNKIHQEQNHNYEALTTQLKTSVSKIEELFEEIPLQKQIKSNLSDYESKRSFRNTQSIARKTLFSRNQEDVPKRESFGLLPDNCWTSEVSDEQFLNTFTTNNCYESKPTDTLADVCKNESLSEEMKALLLGNRSALWNCINDLRENVLIDLQKLILNSVTDKTSVKLDRGILIKLQVKQIENEVQVRLFKLKCNELVEEIRKRKDYIFTSAAAKKLPEDILAKQKDKLEMVIRNIGVDAKLFCLKAEVNLKKQSNNNPFQEILQTSTKVKEQIARELSLVNIYMEAIKTSMEKVESIQNAVRNCVSGLNRFSIDLNWAEGLNQQVALTEVKIFKDFPLQFNKKLVNTKPDEYFRNICTEILPFGNDEYFTDNNVYLFASIISNPSSFENTLRGIVQAKLKLEKLRALQFTVQPIEPAKSSLDDLKGRERYIQVAIDKFDDFIYSAANNHTKTSELAIKQSMANWSDYKYTDFISNKRLVDGLNYAAYVKKFEQMFNEG